MQARTGSAFGSGLLVVGMAALAPATAARGDGPGMLVYSTNQPPGTAHLDAPLRSFRAVGELGTLPNIALPMILRDGRPFVQVGTAAFSSAFAAIPPDVTSVSAIGLTTNFVIAITDAGEARAWGPAVPTTLPAGPHVDLSTYADIAALV